MLFHNIKVLIINIHLGNIWQLLHLMVGRPMLQRGCLECNLNHLLCAFVHFLHLLLRVFLFLLHLQRRVINLNKITREELHLSINLFQQCFQLQNHLSQVRSICLDHLHKEDKVCSVVLPAILQTLLNLKTKRWLNLLYQIKKLMEVGKPLQT